MLAYQMREFAVPCTEPSLAHTLRYRGTYAAQSPRVLDALDALWNAMSDEPPMTILEIGCYEGGFTAMLADHELGRRTLELHTYDRGWAPKALNTLHVYFHQADCFADPLLESLIRSPGRCLVFCDGGDKEREVRTFGPYLKPRDVLCAHDYLGDPTILEAAGGWPCIESRLENLRDDLERMHCVPFVADEMQRAAWGCWIRT